MGPLKLEDTGELFTGVLSLDGYSIAERRLEDIEFHVDVEDGVAIQKSVRLAHPEDVVFLNKTDLKTMWKHIQQNDCFQVAGSGGHDDVYQEFTQEERDAYTAKAVDIDSSNDAAGDLFRAVTAPGKKIGLTKGKDFLASLEAKKAGPDIELDTNTPEAQKMIDSQKALQELKASGVTADEIILKLMELMQGGQDDMALGNYEPVDLADICSHFDDEGNAK